MVKQKDIVQINFHPQKGHEQAGYCPALIVSNNDFNKYTNMTILCPIANTDNQFPLHVPLDDRTKTTGNILCEYIRAVDLNARKHKIIEQLPDDIFEKVIQILKAEIEIPDSE